MIQQFHSCTYIQKKTVIQKDKCTPMFIAALFTIAKTWNPPKCPPTDEWMTMEYYSTRKNQNNAICSNMNGSGDYHTK